MRQPQSPTPPSPAAGEGADGRAEITLPCLRGREGPAPKAGGWRLAAVLTRLPWTKPLGVRFWLALRRLAGADRARAAAEPGIAAGVALRDPRLPRAAARQISVLRDAGAEPRPGLGLCRDLEPRPWRLLRPRRVCDGHVSDAPDRHPRRLSEPGIAGFHGVPELAGIAVVLVGLRPFRLCDGDGAAGARRCSPSFSAGSPSARASPASISRSSPRR